MSLTVIWKMSLRTIALLIVVVSSTAATSTGSSIASITATKSVSTFASHLQTQTNQKQCSLLSIRGGQQRPPPSSQDHYTASENSYNNMNAYNNNNNNNNNNNDAYDGNGSGNYYANNDPEDGFANYNPPASSIDNGVADHLFQETVQDRVEKWRQEQISQQQKMTSEQEMNPRDAQGRMKLIASVSKGSRVIIFFLMMWRDIHLYELADQAFKGSFRMFTVTPLITLFIGNLAGVVASFTPQSHANKKRMKAILNLDKLVEGMLLIYYFFRLTVAPSKYVPRELYVAKTIHSIMFMLQLQAFTRVNWDELLAPGGKGKNIADRTYQAQSTTSGYAPQNEYYARSNNPQYVQSETNY